MTARLVPFPGMNVAKVYQAALVLATHPDTHKDAKPVYVSVARECLRIINAEPDQRPCDTEAR